MGCQSGQERLWRERREISLLQEGRDAAESDRDRETGAA